MLTTPAPGISFVPQSHNPAINAVCGDFYMKQPPTTNKNAKERAMKTSLKVLNPGIIALYAFVTPAFSQPPDPVTSDSAGNTAMGTKALLEVIADNKSIEGHLNTAAGYYALSINGSGFQNTAIGTYALQSNTGGEDNTAAGALALSGNGMGHDNTAVGTEALLANSTGDDNTSVGSFSLASNTTGSDNTAVGQGSLFANSTGAGDSAIGYGALSSNSTGTNNTAAGTNSLDANTTGNNNTGLGASSLAASTTGGDNTAVGGAAMAHNVSGSNNVAVGNNALKNDSAGNDNIAVGFDAGDNLQGSNNIAIGNTGSATDSGVVRIGTPGTQTALYLAGVATTHVTGASVIVTASGQLGVLASSERYKTDIESLSSSTEKLSRLRPVSFHLTSEPTGPVQYGLIAEEVDKVYPELVIRDDKGAVQGVRYDELAPMLLAVMKRQQATIESQAKHAANQDAEMLALKLEEEQKVSAQDAEIAQLKQQLAEIRAALLQRMGSDKLVAQR